MPLIAPGSTAILGSSFAEAAFQGDAVQTTAALTALLPEQRFDQQERFVEGPPKEEYHFDLQSAAASNPPDILVPDDSPATGRWFRHAPGGGVPAAHAPSHAAATGGDPLSTVAAGAIAIGDAAAVGTAETFSRADHQHSLASPGAPANVTKDISDEGSSGVPARQDHKHDISTAAAGAIAVGAAAAEGTEITLARADHQHSLAAPAAPANVTKAAAAAGAAVTVARADHKHDIDTAAPPTIGTANAEGSATSLARSDHVHDHGAQTVGTHHAAVIAAGASGFMTGADKTKIDDLTAQTINTVSTTDATVTTIATIPIADDSVNVIDVRCLARRTDVDEAAGYVHRAIVFRRAAGGATLLGAEDSQFTREEDNQWDFEIVVSGNNVLLEVTGRASRNIDWVSFHELRTIT